MRVMRPQRCWAKNSRFAKSAKEGGGEGLVTEGCMLFRDNVRLVRRGLVPLGRLVPPGVALEGLGRPIRTPSVLGEKRDISFACSRATTRHKNRRRGPLGVALGRRMGTSEARTKEWALQSPSAASTDRYAVEDGCGGAGGRLRTGACSTT